MVLSFIFLMGIAAYINVPKESRPDVHIPVIFVSLEHRGISPEDAEALLIKPMEQQLKNLDGLKNFSSFAFEGGAHVILDFHAGFDSKKALGDVRDKVDIAKTDLPSDTDEPEITEVSTSRFPILYVCLYGEVPKRTLYKIAEDLKRQIESLPEVLEVILNGKDKEVVEALLKPEVLQTYKLITPQLLDRLTSSNKLTSAGSVETVSGSIPLKSSGTFKTTEDIKNLPLLVDETGGQTITDIADVRRTYEDPESYTRFAGEPTVTLKISKRAGENILQTVEKIRTLVKENQKKWPTNLHVGFAADESNHIWDMIHDLQNEIASAVILVMIVIIASLGLRSALLVGMAIPGSFLMGILFLSLQGFTLNIVVLFSLILSVGMLVDGAIIVVEFADRQMAQGVDKSRAFINASRQMFWPVVTSITTIIVAFMPLLFWPGIVGQFMRYMPITLIATLLSSILMALIFVPTLGSFVAKRPQKKEEETITLDQEPLSQEGLGGFTKYYVTILDKFLQSPWRVLGGTLATLGVVIFLFSHFGKGVEFFPDVEPDNGFILIKAQGNLSLNEKDRLVRQVEDQLLQRQDLQTISSYVGKPDRGDAQDQIGSIFVEFKPWQERGKVVDIMQDILFKASKVPGIVVEDALEKPGPSGDKPIQVEFSSAKEDALNEAMDKFLDFLRKRPGVRQVEDRRSPPGIEWRFTVDKFKAAQYQVDWRQIGDTLKVLTNGVKVGDYRPEDSVETVDIILRYPKSERSLDNLEGLSVPTPLGMVPLSNFVKKTYGKRTSIIRRGREARTYRVKADVDSGTLVQPHLDAVKAYVNANPQKGVSIVLKGEEEDQNETKEFLKVAFGIAVFLIALILVTQFNSFYSMALVLSAVVISTIGVLLGLLIRGMPFGIVMGGIGVIALAGIIVSNNIILIDTFDHFSKSSMTTKQAIIKACALRLRPVILTKLTTVLGLLPIMLGININYLGLSIDVGAPGTQWWTMLATAIVFGVLFASPLTLIVTPCALMVRGSVYAFFGKNLKTRGSDAD